MGNTVIDNYIAVSGYYKTSFTYGASEEIADSTTTYVVTEVTRNGDLKARGYLVTEKNTDKFRYFVDVNRTNFEMFVYDANDAISETFTGINLNSLYANTGDYDLLYMAFTASPSGKRRFWGRGTQDCYWDNVPSTDGVCRKMKMCANPYYMLWFNLNPGYYPVGGLELC